MRTIDDKQITAIGEFEYEGNTDLTEISIPDGVQVISEGAFLGCTSLRRVDFPSSVTCIGDSAFTMCSALESIVIPEGVSSIGECAFSRCDSLKSATLPESIVKIGADAFDGCPCQKEVEKQFKDIIKRRKEQEKKLKEEEERRKAEAARIAAEEEAKRKAEEKRKAQEEADRKKAEEKQKAKEEADRKKTEEEKATQEKAQKGQKAKTTKTAKSKPEEQPLNMEDDGLPYVDLGLSVKWAKCNLGAKTLDKKGDVYAWGETKKKTLFRWSTYKFGEEPPFSKYQPKVQVLVKKHLFKADEYKTVGDNKTVLDLCDDVANAEMGGKWRIPTIAEFTELCRECTWTCQTVNGKKGCAVRSNKKGYQNKWIFFPFAPYGQLFILWTSSLADDHKKALCVKIYNQGKTVIHAISDYTRDWGLYIRPVTK